MLPDLKGSSFEIREMSVDLPLPFSPIMAVTVESGKETLRESINSPFPYEKLRFLISITVLPSFDSE
jgi:hypothetical protein